MAIDVSHTTTIPTIEDFVLQDFSLAPLGGPGHVSRYLERFPDELYDKSPDSHWVRFLYTLLGPAGIGWLQKQFLEARLALERAGFEVFDLERYYGDPFRFGRILEESFDQDPNGLLTQEEWDEIKAKDESYRSRAMDFFGAARLGTTPDGMYLAARSGLAHEVEIIENYKALFDAASDLPIGLEYWGQTTSNNEFIVVPRKEVSTSEVQVLTFEDTTVAGGNIVLIFGGQQTNAIAWDADYFDVQTELMGLSSIGTGNVEVSGGYPNPFRVYFMGELSDQDVPELQVISALVDSNGDPKTMTVSTDLAGQDASTEVLRFSDRQMHNMQVALDYLRPVNSLPTFAKAPSNVRRHPNEEPETSSARLSVIRYVTGSSKVKWLDVDSLHWIERGVEKAAPGIKVDPHHYAGYHNIREIHAYRSDALDDAHYEDNINVLDKYKSQHVGSFSQPMRAAIPFLNKFTDRLAAELRRNISSRGHPEPTQGHNTEEKIRKFTADMAQADYPEQPVVTGKAQGQNIFNGCYPGDYTALQGVPAVKYKGDQFWASEAHQHGNEFLEIDLGSCQAVNFVSFDAIQEPIDIDISFDVLDQAPRRHFVSVTPDPARPFFNSLHYTLPNLSPWESLEYHFGDARGNLIFTRFIRIKFQRRDTERPFIFHVPGADHLATGAPWNTFCRNLRIGRNFA